MQAMGHFFAAYGWFIGVPLLFIVVVAVIFRRGSRRSEEDRCIPFDDEGHGHD